MATSNTYPVRRGLTHSEYMEALSDANDAMAGHYRIVQNLSRYVRLPEEMNTSDLGSYSKGAVYTSKPKRMADALVGMVFSKQPEIKLPDGFKPDFRLEGRKLTMHEFSREIVRGIFVDGRRVMMTDPEGYVVVYRPESVDEVSAHRVVIHESTELVDKKQERVLLIYEIQGGIVMFTRQFETSGTMKGGGWQQLILRGNTMTDIPVTVLNAFDQNFSYSLGPLNSLIKISFYQFGLLLEEAQSSFYTSAPQPVISGVSKESQVPGTISPRVVWNLGSENAKAYYLTYDGPGMSDRRAMIDRADQDMVAVGVSLFVPRNLQYTVASSMEISQKESISSMTEIVANISNAVTHVLREMAIFQDKDPADVTFKLNDDLISQMMTADTIRALTEMHDRGLLSYETLISVLKRGDVLPVMLEAEDERQRIEIDPTQLGFIDEDQQRQFRKVRGEAA